jgi:RPA family protein
MDRSADLKFTIGMKSKYLTVSQAGPGGSVEALIVYSNNFDKVAAVKDGNYWPYPDQSDCWQNQTGSGSANVGFGAKNITVRNNSNSKEYSNASGVNNIFFGKSGNYFMVSEIEMPSSKDFTLSFGTIRNLFDATDNTFVNSEFHVWISNDGEKWVEVQYAFAGGPKNGAWDMATSSFSLSSTVSKLYIAFTSDIESSHRIDDLSLVMSSEVGTLVDFSTGVAKDFGAGSNSNPGTGDLPEGTGEGTEASPYDAAKATKLASALGQDDKITGVYVKGIVKSIKEVSTQYGNATYYITDADGAANFYVYRGKNVGNTSFTSADQIKVGDNVVIYGDLMNYMGNSPQLGQGNYLILNSSSGETPGGGNEGPVEEKTVTVAEFLAAEVSTNVFYTIKGTIISIEDINTQYKNATLTIQDNTGSLYVYRMKAAEGGAAIDAIGLTVGDELTVKGNRGDYNGNPQMVSGVYVSHVDKEAPADNYNASIVFSECGYANAQSVNNVEIKIDDNITCVFSQGKANNEPAYYDSGSAIRMYQNGALLDVKAANGKKIKAIELTFGSNMYYLGADSGNLSAESAVRTWTGDASAVRFTATGTDKNHRAYIAAIKVAYE